MNLIVGQNVVNHFSCFWLCSEILPLDLAMYESLNQQKGNTHYKRICGPRFTVHAELLKKSQFTSCALYLHCNTFAHEYNQQTTGYTSSYFGVS